MPKAQKLAVWWSLLRSRGPFPTTICIPIPPGAWPNGWRLWGINCPKSMGVNLLMFGAQRLCHWWLIASAIEAVPRAKHLGIASELGRLDLCVKGAQQPLRPQAVLVITFLRSRFLPDMPQMSWLFLAVIQQQKFMHQSAASKPCWARAMPPFLRMIFQHFPMPRSSGQSALPRKKWSTCDKQ